MNSDIDETNTTAEIAKATGEVSKSAREGIEASRELGRFLSRFIGGPLEQASGIVEEKLRYARWERRVRLMKRAEQFLAEQGLEAPTRHVPMKIALPIFEAASLEEDDELQDTWARLLVNAADADSAVDVERGFVTILQDLGPLEARLLQAIHDAPPEKYPHGAIETKRLPSEYVDPKEDPGQPPEPVQIALWNLRRLGCLESGGTWDSLVGVTRVRITALGRALVRACTLQDKN